MAEHFKEACRCPLCLTYLENPVNMRCGYICCLHCTSSLRKEPSRVGVLCPYCSEVSQKNDMRPNSQLGRLVSKLKDLEPQLRTVLQMNPRVRKFQVDMTLDVDTANNYLIISEDLRRVRCGYFEQERKAHAMRFNFAICVLGSPRFTSGRHYWEVDVGTSKEWNVGVCQEFVPRQGEIVLSSDLGFWTVSSRSEDICSASTDPLTVLPISPRIHHVGVFLDMGMGAISFYHVGNGSHIFTFPKICPAEPLRPFFAPANPVMDDESFLTICPAVDSGIASSPVTPGEGQ